MGCSFESGIISRDLTQEQVERELESKKEIAKYEYGHRGYTGSLAEARGIVFIEEDEHEEFPCAEDAEDWLMDNAPKFGPIYVVKTSTDWVWGANCAS